MRKVVLCLTALVLSASPGVAGQRGVILYGATPYGPVLYGPTLYGPVPTGIYVGGRCTRRPASVSRVGAA
jgi:hypothetical protein